MSAPDLSPFELYRNAAPQGYATRAQAQHEGRFKRPDRKEIGMLCLAIFTPDY